MQKKTYHGVSNQMGIEPCGHLENPLLDSKHFSRKNRVSPAFENQKVRLLAELALILFSTDI